MYWEGCRRSKGHGVSFGTVRITHLDSADDAGIFAETTEVLARALDLLNDKAEQLGIRVSWINTKVQVTSWMGELSQFL